MKFVTGWLSLRPGKRDEFMALARPFMAATLSSTDPDAVIALEKYRTPGAHDLHHQTPHFAEMWGHVQRLCIEGRFENIFAGRVEPDFARFADPDYPKRLCRTIARIDQLASRTPLRSQETSTGVPNGVRS